MGQEVVDPRGTESDQRIMYEDRIVGHVDRAQQSLEEMPVLGQAKQFEPSQRPFVTAAAPVVEPVPVVRRPVAVQGEAHLDVELLEHLQVRAVQPHTVGVNVQIEVGRRSQRTGELRADRP